VGGGCVWVPTIRSGFVVYPLLAGESPAPSEGLSQSTRPFVGLADDGLEELDAREASMARTPASD
jgi:hypothetical protein